MYGKIFRTIYDSSIAEDYLVRLVFQDLLILSDEFGVIDKTPESIARQTNVPLEVVARAIAILEQPDPNSRTPEEDGRRIVRLDEFRSWGWRIVNKKFYRDLKDREDEREKTRLRVARYREKQRSKADSVTDETLQGVTGNAVKRSVTLGNAEKRHTDTDTDTKIKKEPPTEVPKKKGVTGGNAPKGTRIPEPFLLTREMREAARKELGEKISDEFFEAETRKFVDYWRAATGTNAKKLDWVATWRNWIRKAVDDANRKGGGGNGRGGGGQGTTRSGAEASGRFAEYRD